MNLTYNERSRIRDNVYQYINDYCIFRVLDGNYSLPALNSINPYTWQIYMRRGLFNAKFLNCIGVLFWDMYAEQYKNKPFQVAGLETGSTPLLVGIGMTAALYDIDINVVSIRKDRKQYGLFNRFEGILDYNLPVVIVDDLSNSANTIALAMYYCKLEQLDIYDSGFVILNKDVERTHPNFDKYIGPEFKINSLFKIDDFDLTVNDYIKNNPNKQYVDFIREKSDK